MQGRNFLLLWNPKFHCRAHKTLSLEPLLKRLSCVGFTPVLSSYLPLGFPPVSYLEAKLCMHFSSFSYLLTTRRSYQITPHVTRQPNIHDPVRMSPSLDPILSQLNSTHKFTYYSFIIHFNIIIPSCPL
jgi:hypothetical protein